MAKFVKCHAEGEEFLAHAEALLEQKRRLDPMLFETMYQGNPSSAEGVLYGDRFATYDKLPERTIKKGNYTDEKGNNRQK